MGLLASALAVYASAALLAVTCPRPALGVGLSALRGGCHRSLPLPTFGCWPVMMALIVSLCRWARQQPGSRFHLDTLSAFFGLIVNLGIAASSLYGMGIGRPDLSNGSSPSIRSFAQR